MRVPEAAGWKPNLTPKGAGRPAHPTRTHPLLLILHQYLLQSHFLAGLAMLCLKHLPAGREGDPRELFRPFPQGPPLPHQRRTGKGIRAGLGRVPRALGYPTTRCLRSLSEPLPPSPHPGVSRRYRSTHMLLSATPPCPPSRASSSSPPASSVRPGRAAARPSETTGQVYD